MGSLAGRKRLGQYELREKIGDGGGSEVYKAFDTQLHREVAIKLLHADLRADPEFMTRFSDEARFVAALHHPNIVQIHDFQTTQLLDMNAPIAYMVMDYVEGETLADYIRRTSRAGKFPTPTDIVHLFTYISKAIDYAHRESMIHRDIKPANILLDKRRTGLDSIGEPVLTDFGIAKIVGASSDTMTGMLLGTPLYVSPEQAQGYPGTKHSDLYSLGVILYEICTGVCPFQSESVNTVIERQIHSTPVSPNRINSTIPPALAAVILRAIAKDPAKRFSSASALTAAVAEAFHLPVPTDLFLPAYPSNPLLEPTHLRSDRPSLSPHRTPQKVQWSQHPPVMDFLSQLSSVSKVKSRPPISPWRGWKRPLTVWFLVLFVLVGSTLVSLILLNSGPAKPTLVGTLTFTNSGQYDANTTVGYNDIVTLSLHGLTTPQTGMADFVWLLPEQTNEDTVPLLLGRLPINAGKATLQYASQAHTNLLAQYCGVRVIEQPANNDPSTPSLDPKAWRWEGWIPTTPTPGDAHQYSLWSHLKHLLAQDTTLQGSNLPGGLVIWMTRNLAKVEEWSSAAQGGWGLQMSDGDGDLIHRQLLRMLDYLDGQTYVGQDVPVGSNWLADPSQPGKFGLLSYTQDQQPPGYLQHVHTHLNGLTASPGHTDEQKQVAIQVDGVIARMIADLTQVRKDAVQLVQRSDEQLRQSDTLTLLDEMATLTTEVKGGWFDSATSENLGGVIWLSARIQQLATIPLATSKRQ